jgi:hypothetical protein
VGTNPSGGPNLFGNIFTLTPPAKGNGAWVFRNVYLADARSLAPGSGLVPDGAGGFYGSTGAGGAHQCGSLYHFQPPAGGKTMGVLKTLYAFTGGKGGGFPAGELVLNNGALYGVTFGIQEDYCTASSVVFRLPVGG